MIISFFDREENIVVKGEIACFQKTSFPDPSKGVWEWAKLRYSIDFHVLFQLQVRSLALRVLREILRNQSQRFQQYAELTMLRILEAHKDPAKEVSLLIFSYLVYPSPHNLVFNNP